MSGIDVELLSSGELAQLAQESVADGWIMYSLDVHTTQHGRVVESSTLVECECGSTTSVDELWLAECCDEPTWIELSHNARRYHVPEPARLWGRETLDSVDPERARLAALVDISEPEIDEWCGEYLVETVSLSAALSRSQLDALWDEYGTTWDESEQTMGMIGSGISHWLPARSISEIEYGWEPDPIFAGSLYVFDSAAALAEIITTAHKEPQR